MSASEWHRPSTIKPRNRDRAMIRIRRLLSCVSFAERLMPRLFTALELPKRVAGQMALARGGVVGARWLEPEDYHITLRFVGDIDARAAHDIAETLSGIRRPKAA